MIASLQTAGRSAILSSAHNPVVERLVQRWGMRMGAARFVAGETLDGCIDVLRDLNQRGFKTNTTLLGEAVTNAEEANAVTDQYVDIIGRLAKEALRANVSLKLTQLGLESAEGERQASRNLLKLLRVAAELHAFVRVDMEEARHVETTLRIYREMRSEGLDNVGVVLQAYLYRTGHDLDELMPVVPNVRIVKGAYLEPKEVAFPSKPDVDRNYIRLAEKAMECGLYTAIATHDDRIIEHMIAFAQRKGIGRGRFEFQMLYGVRQRLQDELLKRGFRVLVATPFGSQWYPYLMRRLAERPANVGFLVRNLLR